MTRKPPVKPRQNLTQVVIQAIRKQIEEGALKTGDKLPTEPRLIEQFGVSRTVIREAVASLRADGLVDSRHGVGVFVRTPDNPRQSLGLLVQDPRKISDAIEALELRTAVEVEAATLAAMRCSPAQEAELYARYYELERQANKGANTEKEDFEFHVAIAQATNNQRFVEFLTLVGRRTIPRARLREEAGLERDPALEQRLNDEHREILEAIAARDPERAQRAMRAHLTDSSGRYRALARAAQQFSDSRES